MADNAAQELHYADLAPPEGPPPAGETTGTEQPAEGHGAKPGLPQLDATTFAGQLFWLVISFVTLYLVISRIAAPKISGVIGARAGRIKGDLDQAAEAKRASEAALAGYEKALSDARARAQKLGEQMRQTVQKESDEKNAIASKQLAADLQKAEARISEMRKAAMARVGDVARDTAADIVAKLTGETANAGDLDSAVRDALKQA